MKMIVLLAAMIGTSSAFGYSTYVAKEHTCSELRSYIASEGKVLLKGPWIFSRFMYSSPNACDRFTEKAIKVRWKAQDGGCTLAWACERDSSNDR